MVEWDEDEERRLLDEYYESMLEELHGAHEEDVADREPMFEEVGQSAADRAPNHMMQDVVDESRFGLTILDDYLLCFDRVSHGNLAYGRASLHCLMGQLPNIRNLRVSGYDARVHIAFFAPSGSGKGEGMSFAANFAKRLRLNFQSLESATTAALAGTVISDPKTGEAHIQRGMLDPEYSEGTVHIIGIGEAGGFITEKPGPYALETMDLLQTVMNTYGTIDNQYVKILARPPRIEFNSQCSLFLTTYPLEQIRNILVKRGLLQRVLLITETVTLDEQIAVIRRLNKTRAKKGLKDDDFERLEQSVAARLRSVDAFYEGKTDIPFSDDAVDLLNHYSNVYADFLRGTRPAIRKAMGTFVVRYHALAQKLALHYACLHRRLQIEPADVGAAYSFMRVVFEHLTGYFENTLVETKDEIEHFQRRTSRVLDVLKYLLETPKYVASTDGWVLKEDLITTMMRHHKMSRQGVHGHLEELLEGSIIEEKVLRNEKTGATLHCVRNKDFDVDGLHVG